MSVVHGSAADAVEVFMFVGGERPWGLLGSRHVDDEGAVSGATDLEGPWAAADVAVPNELTFVLRVDVYFDVLEAVRASDLGGVVHRV